MLRSAAAPPVSLCTLALTLAGCGDDGGDGMTGSASAVTASTGESASTGSGTGSGNPQG